MRQLLILDVQTGRRFSRLEAVKPVKDSDVSFTEFGRFSSERQHRKEVHQFANKVNYRKPVSGWAEFFAREEGKRRLKDAIRGYRQAKQEVIE